VSSAAKPEKRAKRKQKTGIVTSVKMHKTIVVMVEQTFRHPFYQKVVRRTVKFKVHDETNSCQVGDLVEIMETRPISKEKHWRLLRVIGKGKVALRDLPKKIVEAKAEVDQPVAMEEAS